MSAKVGIPLLYFLLVIYVHHLLNIVNELNDNLAIQPIIYINSSSTALIDMFELNYIQLIHVEGYAIFNRGLRKHCNRSCCCDINRRQWIMSKGTCNIKVNMNCGCLNVKAIDKGDKLNFDMFSHELQCVY